MPKYLVLVLLCFCCLAVSAQQKEKHTTSLKIYRVKHSVTSPHDDCVFTNKLALGERLKRYPFGKAIKIIAVSYRNFNGGEPTQEVRIDTGKIAPIAKFDTLKYGLRVKDGVLNSYSILEMVVLNKVQINTLTNLIYNTDFRVKGNNGVNPGSKCFSPRNALLFIDQHGKIFDYLQICFACENYESKSGQINLGTECYQKIALAKKWFIDAGFQFGTKKKMKNE